MYVFQLPLHLLLGLFAFAIFAMASTPNAQTGTQPSRNRSSGASTASTTIANNLVNLDAAAETPPPYTPLVTPPPDQDSRLAEMGYTMSTFYTCNTIGGREHCGWHVPVMKKADGANARTDVRVVLGVVACLAGVFAWGML